KGRIQVDGYVTDIITDMVIDWIDVTRDGEKPFMVMYQHKAPHRTWMPSPDHLTLYEGKEIPEPATLVDNFSTRSRASRMQNLSIKRNMTFSSDLKIPPGLVAGVPHEFGGYQEGDVLKRWKGTYGRMDSEQRSLWDSAYGLENESFRTRFESGELSGEDLVRWKYQRYIKDYLRSVASIDDNLGRLLKYLDESGLVENTVVIYASDQGFFLGDHGWYDKRF